MESESAPNSTAVESVPRQIESQPQINALEPDEQDELASLKRDMEVFYRRRFSLEIPNATSLASIGVSRQELFREIVRAASDMATFEDEVNLGRHTLEHDVFHALMVLTDCRPENMRAIIGERTIRYVVMQQAIQFRDDFRPHWSRQLTTRRGRGGRLDIDERLEWLSSIPDVNPSHEDVCSVCLEKLNTAACVKIPYCQHNFHRVCIATWFQFDFTCPLCRQTANN